MFVYFFLKRMYNEKVTVNNNEVYVEILINHTSDFIIKSKFFELFRDLTSQKIYGCQLLYRTYF